MSDRGAKIKPLYIGHVSCDLVDGRCALGGGVSFASKWSVSQKIKPKVITSCSLAYEGLAELESWGVELVVHDSAQTTSFTNIYMEEERTQYISAVADKIPIQLIESHVSEADYIFVTPIAQDLDPMQMLHFPKGILMACSIQGWLRHWDGDGRVYSKNMDWDVLKRADLIFLSYEDVEGLTDAISEMTKLKNILIVTDGANGCDIYKDAHKTHYPAPPVQVHDLTGAGDTFAAAFLYHYIQFMDISSAASFANQEASRFIST